MQFGALCIGVPHTLIAVIKGQYSGASSGVLHNSQLGSSIPVESGVRQVYVWSPLLFITVLGGYVEDVVESFVYLGCMITASGASSEDISNRKHMRTTTLIHTDKNAFV